MQCIVRPVFGRTFLCNNARVKCYKSFKKLFKFISPSFLLYKKLGEIASFYNKIRFKNLNNF